MTNSEKVIYDLRSYNFTKRKLQANILLADYLEKINEISANSNVITVVFKSNSVIKLTNELLKKLEEL